MLLAETETIIIGIVSFICMNLTLISLSLKTNLNILIDHYDKVEYTLLIYDLTNKDLIYIFYFRLKFVFGIIFCNSN